MRKPSINKKRKKTNGPKKNEHLGMKENLLMTLEGAEEVLQKLKIK